MIPAYSLDAPQPTPSHSARHGVPRGTEVLTLKGLCPVETLKSGDKVVTRTGARPLWSLQTLFADRFAMMFERPQVVYLMDGLIHSESGAAFTTC